MGSGRGCGGRGAERDTHSDGERGGDERLCPAVDHQACTRGTDDLACDVTERARPVAARGEDPHAGPCVGQSDEEEVPDDAGADDVAEEDDELSVDDEVVPPDDESVDEPDEDDAFDPAESVL